MPAPTTTESYLDLVRKSQMVDEARLSAYLATRGALDGPPAAVARELVRAGLLTTFQAQKLLEGKWRGFFIGKYRVLQPLDAGGVSRIYLCQHPLMLRLVAIKVLPPNQPREPSVVPRLYREAQAIAAFNHPNLIRTHDVDQDGDMHYLVMEYVDGSNLRDVVLRHGSLSVPRAVNYAAQAAQGLQHAHAAGWVHREVKPSNLLLDRRGVIKILDLGLARSTLGPPDRITEKYDAASVLGSADFLAPEQAIGRHDVDARADIYGLGGTLYFLLTGSVPFPGGTVVDKLLRQQQQEPRSLRRLRPEVPSQLDRVVRQMMAKLPSERYQSCAAVLDALRPWLQAPVEPPGAAEMPRLCTCIRTLLDDRPEARPFQGHATVVPSAVAAETQVIARPAGVLDTEELAALYAPLTPEVEPAEEEPAPRLLPVVRPLPTATPPRIPAHVAQPRTAEPRKPLPIKAVVFLLAVPLAAAVLGWVAWNSGLLSSLGGMRPGPSLPSSFQGVMLEGTPLTTAQASTRVGQSCVVEMVVASVDTTPNPPSVLLYSEVEPRRPGNFTVVVDAAAREGYKGQGIRSLTALLWERRIRVKGNVTRIGGRAGIVVSDTQSIQIVEP